MLVFIYIGLVSFVLIVVLKFASVAMAERVILNREELSPYECGFEHHNVSRIPFSLRYFFLTLLFLLFDLEVVFLLFSPALVSASLPFFSYLVVIFFLVVLYLSLIYEWSDGTLEWLV